MRDFISESPVFSRYFDIYYLNSVNKIYSISTAKSIEYLIYFFYILDQRIYSAFTICNIVSVLI